MIEISSSLRLSTAATLRPSTPALPPFSTTSLSALCRFFSDHTLSMSRNHFPSSIPVSRALSMRVVHTLASTQAQRARSLRLVEARALARPLTTVSLAGLFPSRFHLPVPLRSIPVTGLLRYYEDSDAFRAALRATCSHELRFPSQIAFPTSPHSNFQPSCLQPSQSSPSRPFRC